MELEFNVNGMSVCFAIPCYQGTVPIDLMASFMRTVDLLKSKGVSVAFISERENGLIDSARNRLVHRFLHETDCQKLFFIDSDIVWDAEDALKLLCFSKDHRMLCGTYQARKDPPTYFLGLPDEPPVQNNYGLIPITGVGFGFVLLDRDVFVKMKPTTKTYFDKEDELSRYFAIELQENEEVAGQLQYVGEDMYFVRRAVFEYGEEMWLDPTIKLKHYGTKEYTSDPIKAIQSFYKNRS